MLFRSRQLSKTSDQPFSNSIQKIAYAVYRASYNPNYHFETNGELRVIKIISSYFKKKSSLMLVQMLGIGPVLPQAYVIAMIEFFHLSHHP